METGFEYKQNWALSIRPNLIKPGAWSVSGADAGRDGTATLVSRNKGFFKFSGGMFKKNLNASKPSEHRPCMAASVRVQQYLCFSPTFHYIVDSVQNYHWPSLGNSTKCQSRVFVLTAFVLTFTVTAIYYLRRMSLVLVLRGAFGCVQILLQNIPRIQYIQNKKIA